MKILPLLSIAAIVAICSPAVGQTYRGQDVIVAPQGAPPIAYGPDGAVHTRHSRSYAVPAHVQPRAVYAPPGQMPNFGGGFIEGMVVGREPVQRPARSRAYAVPNPGATIYAVPGRQLVLPPDNPRINRQQRSQSAVLNVAPSSRRVMDPAFKRTEIDYHGPHEAGTIVVDTGSRHLFLIQENGRAIRYGVGVGKEGFGWKGTETISNKREWPDWRPPAEMLKRRPELPKFMAGGPENPLGARALYLGNTLYRIHGSNEPWTIGQAVSSGCIRMTNDDVTDLYQRVRIGTKVVVI